MEILSQISVGGTEESLDEELQDIRVPCREPNTPPPEHKSEALLLESICSMKEVLIGSIIQLAVVI
jgi:hypothetical protein